MQEKGYRAWIEAQERRKVYGKNLDELYAKDRLAGVLEGRYPAVYFS